MSVGPSPDTFDLQRQTQSSPLTPKEVEMQHRMLSDPSTFPREFKRWITEHSSDTVDIAKSQVHGLINAKGDIYIPPPSRISELPNGFKLLDYLITLAAGSGGNVISLPNVECDGEAINFEIMMPFLEYNHTRFAIMVDAANAGWVANYKVQYTQDFADGAPPQTVVAQCPVYIQRALQPTKGVHNFAIMAQCYGARTCYMGAGNIYGNVYAPGFVRLSRA